MLARTEDALIAALKALPAGKTTLRTVSSLPKLGVEDLLKRYVADAPGLYVLPGMFTVADGLLTMRHIVAGVVRNVAGQAQGRKGDGIAIGCDQLMLMGIQALHDKTLGGATWKLVRGEMVDDDLFDRLGLSAIELAFDSYPLELDTGLPWAELDDFTRFHAGIDVPPHSSGAEHTKWVAEPPDLSASRPDADLDAQFPGAMP